MNYGCTKADRIAILIVLVLALVVLGQDIRMKYAQKPPTIEPKTKTDTLYLHDTLTIDAPISVKKKKLDSVPVPVGDTITIHDTLFVYLDREQVVWQDSMSVVYASGINPQVDSVKHFRESKIVTIEKTIPVKVRSKWGIGIQAGYGATENGLTPYVGVGLSYNLLSW